MQKRGKNKGKLGIISLRQCSDRNINVSCSNHGFSILLSLFTFISSFWWYKVFPSLFFPLLRLLGLQKSDLELPLLIWQKLFSVSSQFSQSRTFLIASRGETSEVFSLLFYPFFSISKTLIGPTTAALMDRLGLNNDKWRPQKTKTASPGVRNLAT